MPGKADLFEVGEIWYQRTHKLREVWQNMDNPEEKRARAFKLWDLMCGRMHAVTREINRILMSRPLPDSFEPGGFIPINRKA